MIRTQIQLREDQYRALKRRAQGEDRSLADLIRESIDAWLAQGAGDRAVAGLKALSGAFSAETEEDDVSENHDRYLVE